MQTLRLAEPPPVDRQVNELEAYCWQKAVVSEMPASKTVASQLKKQ